VNLYIIINVTQRDGFRKVNYQNVSIAFDIIMRVVLQEY